MNTEERDLLKEAAAHITMLEQEIARLISPPLSMSPVIKDMGKGRVMVASGRGVTIADLPHKRDKEGKLLKACIDTPLAGSLLLMNGSGAIVGPIADVSLSGVEATVTRVFDGDMLEIGGGLGGGAALIFKGSIADCVKPGDLVQLDHTGNVALRIIPKDRSAHTVETATGVCWDDVGGQDAAKAALQEAVEGPIKQAKLYKAYGKKPMKGVLLAGPPGCVDGNATVTLNRAGKGYKTSLKRLHDTFNGIKRRSDWDTAIPTMIRCLFDGELRLKPVLGVYDKGVKAVKRLTLANGKQLLLTPDHEIKTASGFIRTNALTVGSLVYTNGSYISSSDNYEYQCSGLRNHPRARRKVGGGYELAKHILVAEARLNGVTFDTWLEEISRGDLSGMKFIGLDKEVHHKDDNRRNTEEKMSRLQAYNPDLNPRTCAKLIAAMEGVPVDNEPENLEVLTRSTHCKTDKRHRNISAFVPKEVAVTSIEDAGEIHVYDVTVADAHNFVANGIVVHNCGKTLLAKATASAIREAHGKDEADTAFIYIKGPEVLNMWVGNTEAQIRGLFTRAKEHKESYGYPAVIFIDEADAILGKRGGHHASVLSSTIVPTFLAEMDGISDSCAFVLLATNRQDTLDPAIVREGRIDRKVYVGRPAMREAAQILSIHVRKTKVAEDADTLAGMTAAEMFSDSHLLYNVGLKGKGMQPFYVRHLLSGAMLAGIVDVATSNAIRRDTASGKASGINTGDLKSAVGQVVAANRNLNHDEALHLFAESHGTEIEAVQRVAA